MSNQKDNVLSILDKLHKRGTFFPVRREKLKTETGMIVPGKDAIVRGDTDEPIGVVSKSYNLVTNEEAMRSFAEALAGLNIDLANAEPMVNYSGSGAKTMVELIIPSLVWNENSGSPTAFRMIMKNSYDGSWKLEAFGGGLRGACMNGLVFGSYMSRYAARHISSLSIEAAGNKIALALNEWKSNRALWDRMQIAKLSQQSAFAIMCFYAGKIKLADQVLASGIPRNEDDWPRGRIFDYVYRQYKVEKKALGPTAWAMYNTLTHQATHDSDGNTSNRATYLESRRDAVRRTIENPVFTHVLPKAA